MWDLVGDRQGFKLRLFIFWGCEVESLGLLGREIVLLEVLGLCYQVYLVVFVIVFILGCGIIGFGFLLYVCGMFIDMGVNLC